MMKILRCRFAVLGLTLCGLTGRAAPSGAGVHQFIHSQAGQHVTVRYFLPADTGVQAPVVIVMHGHLRNGDTYLEDWAPLAAQYHFLLVTPEFSRAEFPGARSYNFGNQVDAGGRPRSKDEWAFSMIEPIFDQVRQRTGNRSATYELFGHSAGAQFVHRFLYFVPQARVDRVVAANAGWYTLPDFAAPFPYGLKGTPVTKADLRTALGRRFTILLGEADTDPQARDLRRTPEAEAQGANRFARGQNFFRHAQAAAAAQGVPLGWSLATAPGVSHSDKDIARYAVSLLLPAPTIPQHP